MSKKPTQLGEFIEWLDEFETNVCLNVVQVKAMAMKFLPAETENLKEAYREGFFFLPPQIIGGEVLDDADVWFNNKYKTYE